MELSQFVSSSIKQIIDGVIDAQKYASEKDARINPFGMSILKSNESVAAIRDQYGNQDTGQIIDFDVAVTTTEGS